MRCVSSATCTFATKEVTNQTQPIDAYPRRGHRALLGMPELMRTSAAPVTPVSVERNPAIFFVLSQTIDVTRGGIIGSDHITNFVPYPDNTNSTVAPGDVAHKLSQRDDLPDTAGPFTVCGL